MNFFQKSILNGIPSDLPQIPELDPKISRAPKREYLQKVDKNYHTSWTDDDTKLALQNALRYFHPKHHAVLIPEFLDELETYGHIYMYRFRPTYEMRAQHIDSYPAKSKQAAAIMLMIQNNLDPENAQHPYELVTYGGNGSIFQNWAQYLLTMQYLSTMTNEQTLILYSGHPLGLFPSPESAPRVVVTNGMMIPNYSTPDDLNRYNALGVTQYGQMTAGSFMYIGSQGIVHGTTITLLNAGRLKNGSKSDLRGKVFVTSGLGGMSGAQGKAAVIAGCIGVIAEISHEAAEKRHRHGWVDEVYSDLGKLLARIKEAKYNKEAVALAYKGNIVDLWEYLAKSDIKIDLGSDQTSLHNPYGGGYYPTGYNYEEGKELMRKNPEKFNNLVRQTVRRHVDAINSMCKQGMYFFDYGNAFLKFARDEAKADILDTKGIFKYPSYVQDIMGPMCFDYGFGPFRWVCTSCKHDDLLKSDKIATEILEEIYKTAPADIQQQLSDNIQWIKAADSNKLVVGSQARILYADSEGRIKIAEAFNEAIRSGRISAPIVLGRDHHDVSGTDSPFRETANIYDGSAFTADMAVHNFVGDAFRGATWISLHNGGGVGWGEVMNGGFGLVLDGTDDASKRLEQMLFWDVNNGIARRSWAKNKGAISAIQRAMKSNPSLKVTLPYAVDSKLLADKT